MEHIQATGAQDLREATKTRGAEQSMTPKAETLFCESRSALQREMLQRNIEIVPEVNIVDMHLCSTSPQFRSAKERGASLADIKVSTDGALFVDRHPPAPKYFTHARDALVYTDIIHVL